MIDPVRSAIGQVQGFTELRLRSDSVEIAVVPELGAKIISLKNLYTGREWMWCPKSELKLFKNTTGDDFAHSTMAGWDECIPTISPCDYKGRLLPDHGEAWSARWEFDERDCGADCLRTSITLSISQLRLERVLQLSGHRIHARYSLRNLADRPEKFLWAIHPLLRLYPGDHLELTEETKSSLTEESWLDSLEFQRGSPRFAKVFSGPLSCGRAGVFNSHSGDRLTLTWDASENPFLGIWLTRGGWNGYEHLALEPTNAPTDSLDEAVDKFFGVIPPNATREWTVSIALEPANPCNLKT